MNTTAPQALTPDEQALMDRVADEIPDVENFADWANLTAIFGGPDCT